MIDRDIAQVEAPTPFDLFRQRLSTAFAMSGNGEGVVDLARLMTVWYFRDMGRAGNISFERPPSFEEKSPLGSLPKDIQEEVIGLVSGKPLGRDSQKYLRGNFAQGRALIHCILAARSQLLPTND